MKVEVYYPIMNKGILEKTNETITIEPRRWIDKNGTSHPMKFERPVAFKNKNVYFLHLFGDDSGKSHQGKHISLNFWQNQKFMLMQKIHPMQKFSVWLPIVISLASLIVSILK